jgi:arabinofuranan 3-O-arabinosyltransferase
LDNSSATAWQPGLGTPAQIGTTLTYDLPRPQTLSTLSLGIVADGRHSVPTSLTVSADGQSRSITLPAIADSSVPGAVTTVPISFAPLRGQQFVITFTGIRAERAANYYSAGPLTLPLGIAAVGGLTGAPVPTTPSQLPGNCTAGLLSIDGRPIDVAVVGSTQTALADNEVQVVPCGPDAKGITLSAGTHVVETAAGHSPTTGWNLDQLVLDSAAGGGAAAAPSLTASGEPSVPATQAGAAPTVTVKSVHIDTETAKVSGATSPFELVLGQSLNSGWQAIASPGPGARSESHAVNLGTPQLIDSFANGWAVTGSDLRSLGGGDFTVRLVWTPQFKVWVALAVSGATLFICLLLGFLPGPVRRWVRRSGRRVRVRVRALFRRPGWLRRGKAAGAGGEGTIVAANAAATDRAATTDGAETVAHAPVVYDAGPKLEFLRREPRHRVHWWNAILLGLITGVAAAGVTSLAIGGAIALLVIAGLLIPWVRWVAALGAVGFIVTGCVNVVRGQQVHHYLPGSNWAGSFVSAGNHIWIGVVLLLADAVIVSAGARSPRPEPPATAEPPIPT